MLIAHEGLKNAAQQQMTALKTKGLVVTNQEALDVIAAYLKTEEALKQIEYFLLHSLSET